MNKCPNHPKKDLRLSCTYKDIYWCDICVKGWELKDLTNINDNNSFLLSNIFYTNKEYDYPYLYININQKEMEELSKLKNNREDLERSSPITMKKNEIVINPFLNEAFGIEQIALENNDKIEQENLKKLLNLRVLSKIDSKLNLENSKAKSVSSLYCNMIISPAGIRFDNVRSYGDTNQTIESPIILWTDLGII